MPPLRSTQGRSGQEPCRCPWSFPNGQHPGGALIADWLRAIGLQSAGAAGELDRLIGSWQPYATSHAELDLDTAVQGEVRNAARTLLRAVLAQRQGLMVDAGAELDAPRQK
jgi:hypothetical protein